MLLHKRVRYRKRALQHISIGLLPIRCMGLIGKIHKVFTRQGSVQRPQHAQATDAAVKNPNGVALSTYRNQAPATAMPLNSPVAMRFCHSAGPVLWTLVPPASTATVTGMSTTSNS